MRNNAMGFVHSIKSSYNMFCLFFSFPRLCQESSAAQRSLTGATFYSSIPSSLLLDQHSNNPSWTRATSDEPPEMDGWVLDGSLDRMTE
jgi:hypothetical protein